MIEPKDNLPPDQSFAPPPPPWRQSAYNRSAAPVPPMPPMGDNFSGGSLPGVGDLLSQSWSIFANNAGTFIGIIILPFIAQIIAGAVLFFVLLGGLFLGGLRSLASPSSIVSKTTSVSSLILLIIVGLAIVLINILSQAALVYAAVHRERKITLGEAYGFAFEKLPSYLWVAVLSTVIIGGGMFLFVVPGILFAVWFMLAVFVVMGEDARGMSALFKSREYMKGNGIAVVWRILAVAIILGVAFVAIYLGLSFISKAVDFWVIKLIAGLILFFAPIILQPIATALIAIFTALIYDHLRVGRASASYAPSAKQKAIFLGIGILGWIVPVIAFFTMAGSLFSSFSKLKNGNSSFDSKNFQYDFNVNSNSNVNSPLFQDSDNDKITDNTEKAFGTNPNMSDTDSDGLTDGDEIWKWKTKPTNPDTDGDGFKDGDEVKNGYNPLGSGKMKNN